MTKQGVLLVLMLIASASVALACTFSTMLLWEPSSDADPPYYRVWRGKKREWIDRSGKRIRFEPEAAEPDPERLVPVPDGDFYGYLRTGNTVIPPRFLLADEFSEGRARVVVKGPCLPVDGGVCGGRVIVPPSAVPKSVTLLDVQSRRWRPTAPACRYTFINERGEVLEGPEFEDAAAFREGLAAVRIDKLWGYVDQDLSVVIPPRFQWVSSFSESLAAVQVGSGVSYINRTGTVQIAGPFDGAGDFHEGLAVVYRNHQAYFIDKTGRQAVPGTYDAAGRFFHGLANVTLPKGELGYIDRTGRVVYRWTSR